MHIEGCADCYNSLGLAEAMGGQFLESVTPAALSDDALMRVLERLDDADAGPLTTVKEAAAPPLSVRLRERSRTGRRRLWRGIWVQPILKDPAQSTRAYLLGVAAGVTIPRHGHHGREMIQVLQGEFFDNRERYGVNDFLEVDSRERHAPRAGDNEECVCIVACHRTPRGLLGLMLRART